MLQTRHHLLGGLGDLGGREEAIKKEGVKKVETASRHM